MEWEGFFIYYTFFLSECQCFSGDLKDEFIILLFIVHCKGCNYFLRLGIPVLAWLLDVSNAIKLITKWQWCNCILIFMESGSFKEGKK